MTSFLVIHSDYEQTHIGLFSDTTLLEQYGEKNRQASKYLTDDINTLLNNHGKSLNEIDFIAINQGPGPFTTLRVNLATANGIAFASNTRLIGIDGMKTLIKEQKNGEWPYTIALFNAYNKDAYFALQTPKNITTGYKNITVLLDELKSSYPQQQIRFIGSGTKTFEQEVNEILGENAYIPDPFSANTSLDFIAETALKKWEHKIDIADQLFPLYLKKMHYKKQIMPS